MKPCMYVMAWLIRGTRDEIPPPACTVLVSVATNEVSAASVDATLVGEERVEDISME